MLAYLLMNAPQLDEAKYLQIRDRDGIAAAITTLHNDMRELELQTFETDEGYRPEYWKTLEAMRSFSRVIWDSGLENPALLEGTRVPNPMD